MSKELMRLPKDVAEAVERIQRVCEYPIRVAMDTIYREDYAGNEIALREYCESDRSRRIGYIAQALVNGYEIEETPEDKVREYYQTQKAAVVNGHDFDNPSVAIRYVLKCLNIKIEGVW